MKSRTLLLAACVCLAATAFSAQAQTKGKSSSAAVKPKAGTAAAAPQAMDPKAMEEMMANAAAPGPQHERLKKLVGEWNCAVKSTMDPSQPAVETKSTSVMTALMDGRYFQEQVTGEMMGKPFAGMGITGYDNILKKYVGTWIDNVGTGIMTSEGTADATGKVIRWTSEATDPMSGKKMKYRMVNRFVDDNKHTLEMYSRGPDGKEREIMHITYERKM